jgi:hypothetical protein
MLQTSIPKLDELMGGGIEPAKSVLFYSQPGVDELSFMHQILFHRLQEKDNVLYLVNNKIPRILKLNLKKLDYDTEKYEQKGSFSLFDGYSDYLGISSEEKFSSPLELREIKKRLFSALEKIKSKNSLLVIDSLSTFFDICGQKDAISCMKEIITKAKENNITTIVMFTEWPYSEDAKKRIKEIFDCIIELKAVERTIFLRNYFSLSKANWISQLKKQEIPFKIVNPGGVKVYIPKIMVTGPYNAGKSSFVHSASLKAVSVERVGLDSKGTTVALDHGNVDFEGFSADLFGTPGQERFDPLLELLGGDSIGVIVLLDATAPETFPRAFEMLEKTRTKGLPSVIVANKANLHGALKPEQIRKKMKLAKDIPIIPVIAESIKAIRESRNKKNICMLKKEDVNKVLDTLFKEIV